MSEFSCDILHNILSRVPAKDLLDLKAVCKLWRGIIDDPLFVKSHTKNQPSCPADILIQNGWGGGLFSLSVDSLNDGVQHIDLIPVKQLIHDGVPRLDGLPAHSCNGLILITHENVNKSWAIWNPLVQDFHVVPPPPVTDPKIKYDYLVRSGFGYDEASDDYKVVRVETKKFHNVYFRCMIYSLKLGCWRAIEEGYPRFREIYSEEGGAYLKGALHWRSRDGIIALHLGREDHHLLPVPPRLPSRTCLSWWGRLHAFDGCLIFSYDYVGCSTDVWVMKDYETDKTWTKLLFSAANYVRVVAYLKSKGQVLLDDRNSGLKWLHLEDKSVKEINVNVSGPKGRCRLSFGQIYPGSLVRLDSTKSRRAGVKRKRESESERADSYAKVYEKKLNSGIDSLFRFS